VLRGGVVLQRLEQRALLLVAQRDLVQAIQQDQEAFVALWPGKARITERRRNPVASAVRFQARRTVAFTSTCSAGKSSAQRTYTGRASAGDAVGEVRNSCASALARRRALSDLPWPKSAVTTMTCGADPAQVSSRSSARSGRGLCPCGRSRAAPLGGRGTSTALGSTYIASSERNGNPASCHWSRRTLPKTWRPPQLASSRSNRSRTSSAR
jgi:hypothetical protein